MRKVRRLPKRRETSPHHQSWHARYAAVATGSSCTGVICSSTSSHPASEPGRLGPGETGMSGSDAGSVTGEACSDVLTRTSMIASMCNRGEDRGVDDIARWGAKALADHLMLSEKGCNEFTQEKQQCTVKLVSLEDGPRLLWRSGGNSSDSPDGSQQSPGPSVNRNVNLTLAGIQTTPPALDTGDPCGERLPKCLIQPDTTSATLKVLGRTIHFSCGSEQGNPQKSWLHHTKVLRLKIAQFAHTQEADCSNPFIPRYRRGHRGSGPRSRGSKTKNRV